MNGCMSHWYTGYHDPEDSHSLYYMNVHLEMENIMGKLIHDDENSVSPTYMPDRIILRN